MKSLGEESLKKIKTHIGVVISLVALLFSIQFSFLINDLIKSYENVMKDEYSIVLVSSKELNLENLNLKEVSNLHAIDPKNMLAKLEEKISKTSMEKLVQTLPKFYDVTLNFFPNSDELKTISENLKKVDGVSRVEVFAKSHNTIYNILLMLKKIVYVFSVLAFVLSLMLMLKQMRIWVYEHRKRVQIMMLFGAPYMIKSYVLYKMVILDSFIATIIVVLFYKFIPNLEIYSQAMNSLGIVVSSIALPQQALYLFGISLILSVSAVTFVMLSINEENL